MTPAPAIDLQDLEKHTPMMQRDLIADLQAWRIACHVCYAENYAK